MDKSVPKNSNKIKELQVMSITRQDFDDSNKQVDDTKIFLKTDSLLNKSKEISDSEINDYNEEITPIKDLYQNDYITKSIETPIESNEYLTNMNTEISGWAFKENVSETKDLLNNMEQELENLRSWRLQEQDLLEQEILKNRAETKKKMEQKLQREREADELEEREYQMKLKKNDDFLQDRLKNVYSNYNQEICPNYRSLQKTNINNTEFITNKINEGENKLKQVKKISTIKNDMDSVLSDITARLKEYDDLSDSLNMFSQNSQDNEFLDRLSSNDNNSSATNFRRSPSTSESIPGRSSMYNIIKPKDNKKWDEVLPKSPPTGFDNFDFHKRQQASLSLTGNSIENNSRINTNLESTNADTNNSGSRWWKDFDLKNMDDGKNISSCLDDIDKEFEELEKMINDAALENDI